MEEAQSVKEFLENMFLFAAFKPNGIGDGVTEVRSQYIGPETFGRFVGHFHTILEHEHGEMISWIRCQPETEIWMGGIRGEVLTNLERNDRTTQNKLQVL